MRQRFGLPRSAGRSLIGFLLLALLLPAIAACGGNSNAKATNAAGSSTTTSASHVGGSPAASPGASPSASPSASPVASPMTTPAASGVNPSNVSLTIGSKLDVDGQLNAEMYALLLQNAGYKVKTKLSLGQTPVLDKAIKSGAIDIYPEFTGTALSLLKLQPTQDGHKAYNEVKSAYEQQFHITWLDPAYNLNDSYAICTTKNVAQKYHLTTLDDLKPVASKLTIASQQDGLDAAVNPVEQGYNLKFKKVVQISEQLGFGAVSKGDADLNVCYTTDPNIIVKNFVVLKDTKGVFPIYNPAPIVRDDLLQKAPGIAGILNALQPKLTDAAILNLIKQVSVDHKSVQDVAKAFLQDQGLLQK